MTRLSGGMDRILSLREVANIPGIRVYAKALIKAGVDPDKTVVLESGHYGEGPTFHYTWAFTISDVLIARATSGGFPIDLANEGVAGFDGMVTFLYRY